MTTGKDLVEFLAQTAQENRLKTIENVYYGKGGLASNFKAEWRGFEKNNKSTVKVQGKLMNVRTIGTVGIQKGAQTVLRVGQGMLAANW